MWAPEALQIIFTSTRFKRRLDRSGYVQFRYWRFYAEPGLARRPAVVWLSKEQLTIAFGTTELAHYSVEYAPHGKHIREVTDPQIYDTHHRSPQLPLWQFGDDEWLKILRLSRHLRKKRTQPTVTQEQLFAS